MPIKALDLTDRLTGAVRPHPDRAGEEDPGTPVAAARAIHERIEGIRACDPDVGLPPIQHRAKRERSASP